MVEQLLNSLLFYFFSAEFRCREKVRDPPNYPRSVICWDLFLYFWGALWCYKMGDTVGPRYTAPKISAISYLFGTFSLLIMGDTERPRYTGFRGLSVRGITALQCMWHCLWEYYQNYSNYDPGLTLTHFIPRSNLVT